MRAGVAILLAFVVTFASGEIASAASLRQLSPDQRVTSLTQCRGEYRVVLGDGRVLTFAEYNLAFKNDTVEDLKQAVRQAPGCVE